MLIWQKGYKGTVKVRIKGISSYVFVKREKLQTIIGETFNKVHNIRKDCQELSITYGWIVGVKIIELNLSNGEKNIEFYFNNENSWRHEPDVILTGWNELFDEFIKVAKGYEKEKKA